ncbi:protein POF1B [Ahaetulla prasina]|uniref:protein POF1B n=1 Tax=Ahaetulla prasina TaxID=499056 RepID=UPI0026473B9F|nr:protein POF1B [Ahaetulla prasina]
MFGVQQHVQATPLPPPWSSRSQPAVPSPPRRGYCPVPPPPAPSRSCFDPCLAPPPSLPATLPRARQSRPAPLPLQVPAGPDPFPPQEGCNGGGSVVYERVRTYSSPGGKRVQLLEAPNGCSPRALSPFDPSPGYQHVIWSSDPQLQEVPSPALKLSPYSQGNVRRIILENPEKEPLSPLLRGGNNVIYEKTIRKYELLNPDEEKQYQYLQQTQSDQCQVSQPAERIQVVQQCQHTTNACDCTPVRANDVGQSSFNKVIIQTREPVKGIQEINDQLDCRYFGELLAELHRKSNDLHSCLLQHVEKLGGRRCDLESLNDAEDIESLIPKGLSESTKQQIRYLLEMRATADKSMRLVLTTFSNLREELSHLQDDLGKLEMDKMLLEKDLAFKEAQVKEYEMLLASVRENNRQQQQALREYTLKCRSLEEQLLSLRHNDSEREFRLKDLEYSKRALEQEIQNLRLQASTNPLGQTTTDELSSRYVEMINQLREDKDREIRSLRSSLSEFQKDFSRKQGSDTDLQMRLQDLILKLEEREACIKRQEEEIFRLRQDKITNPSQGITKTIITKKYRNHYPILGLLSDDYKTTSSSLGETQTIVIEKTGETWQKDSFTSD